MTVKIITDSLSDITGDIAKELGATVVPVYVRFGEEVYKDRVEITTDEFYHRLIYGNVIPSTTQPTPQDFLTVYEQLADETDEILVITLSQKLSGTYQSALAAKRMLKKDCRVEVIDSEKVVMGLGVIVIAACKMAISGAGLDEIAIQVKLNINRTHAIMLLDTLKYLAKGRRIGRAEGLLGSMLPIKPILTVSEGEVAPLTRMRSRKAGLDYLYNFVNSVHNAEVVAVEHATTPLDAKAMMKRIARIHPDKHIYSSTVSPVIGTYVGPEVLCVAVLGDR